VHVTHSGHWTRSIKTTLVKLRKLADQTGWTIADIMHDLDDEAFPDYAMPTKTTGRKDRARSKRTEKT
jgi:hypothetical protein